MNTVRTTITLPADLHEEMRILSIKEKKSLGELVTEMFRPKEKMSKLSVDKKIKQAFRIFDATAKSSKVDIDAVRAVREERDRDNA